MGDASRIQSETQVSITSRPAVPISLSPVCFCLAPHTRLVTSSLPPHTIHSYLILTISHPPAPAHISLLSPSVKCISLQSYRLQMYLSWVSMSGGFALKLVCKYVSAWVSVWCITDISPDYPSVTWWSSFSLLGPLHLSQTAFIV